MRNIKVLVTGAAGQLGRAVIAELVHRNIKCVGVDIIENPIIEKMCDLYVADLTDKKNVEELFTNSDYTDVIHCAAYTNVNGAELPQNRDVCMRLNVDATRYLAEECYSHNCRLIYISSDYVFGDDGPSDKYEDSSYNPQNFYGFTKMLGEEVVNYSLKNSRTGAFIVRIAGLFSPYKEATNFVNTIVNKLKTQESLSVVYSRTSLTYAPHLAVKLVDMVLTPYQPTIQTIHIVNEESDMAWDSFARLIANAYVTYTDNSVPKIESCAPQPGQLVADRSRTVTLNTSLLHRTFGAMPNIRLALHEYFVNRNL